MLIDYSNNLMLVISSYFNFEKLCISFLIAYRVECIIHNTTFHGLMQKINIRSCYCWGLRSVWAIDDSPGRLGWPALPCSCQRNYLINDGLVRRDLVPLSPALVEAVFSPQSRFYRHRLGYWDRRSPCLKAGNWSTKVAVVVVGGRAAASLSWQSYCRTATVPADRIVFACPSTPPPA